MIILFQFISSSCILLLKKNFSISFLIKKMVIKYIHARYAHFIYLYKNVDMTWAISTWFLHQFNVICSEITSRGLVIYRIGLLNPISEIVICVRLALIFVNMTVNIYLLNRIDLLQYNSNRTGIWCACTVGKEFCTCKIIWWHNFH